MRSSRLVSFLLGLLACCFIGVTMSGCETTQGVGEDIEEGGEEMEEVFD